MLKTAYTIILVLSSSYAAIAQQKYFQRDKIDKLTDSIANEGNLMYCSEWASWYGTDIFLDKCKDKQGQLGGYLSYESGSGLNNVLFTRGDKPNVLATISFTKEMDPQKFRLDTTSRKLTKVETEYFLLRRSAIKRMENDTIFKGYRNTNLNPVPIITNGKKRVYVLTAPKNNGFVLFGNDYFIDFDNHNEIISVSKIHNSLIVAQAGSKQDSSKSIIGALHSHVAGKDEFMTATDICTIHLYEKLTTWNNCTVISKNYVSVWDCRRNTLLILTMEAWQKINPLKSALEPPIH